MSDEVVRRAIMCKVWLIRCPHCGHEWTSASDEYADYKFGCPSCRKVLKGVRAE